MRRFRSFPLGLAALLFLVLPVNVPGSQPQRAAAQEAHTLRIATQAPTGSPWHRAFEAWAGSVEEGSHGRLRLQFFYGGTQGDERDYVRKMEQGQLDGAAVTTTGLSHMVGPVMVLGAPGVFRSYEEIDRVRERLAPRFRREFHDAGFHLVAWGDVGRARFFSKRPIRRPSDLARVRPWARPDDAVTNKFYETIGATPQRLGINELLPALQTGRVNAFPAPALAAVSLQWYHHATHVSARSSQIIVGATVITKPKYDALPADLRELLDSTGRRTQRLLLRSIRRADDRAYEALLARGLTAVDASEFEAEWAAAAETTRNAFAGRLYPEDLLREVVRIANEEAPGSAAAAP